MRVYHYPVILGHGKATFPKVALGSLRGSLASRHGKVVAYSPRGSLYHKRVCLLYSIFKERLAKAQKGFHIEKAVQGRKEGDFNKSCPTVSLILLLVLNQHQSPKSF